MRWRGKFFFRLEPKERKGKKLLIAPFQAASDQVKKHVGPDKIFLYKNGPA
jgi:hypothetical protein